MELLEIISVWGIREPFSTLSHALGAVAALGATIFLVRRARRQGLRGLAVAVYGVTVVLALTASALFHYVEVPPSRLDFYGTIDHVAIFLVIAGTGTAVYSTLESRWADRLVAIIWGLTILAVTAEITVESLGGWKRALIYLAMGWAGSTGLIAVVRLETWRPLRSFIAGAVVFSVGAVVFATDWPVLWPGIIEGHEVFHVLVLLGEAFHFHFVYQYCTCPTAFCRTGPEAVSASALDSS